MTSTAEHREDGSLAFCVLACLGTWTLSAPAAWCFMEHAPPTPLAIAGAGLSAFGPLLAALLLAAKRGRARSIFQPFRAPLRWIVLGLFAPLITHVLSSALFALLGGAPAQWFHPPSTSEQIAALVVFAPGEEFGWRGFLQPRLSRRYGPVIGALLVGLVWGVWHLAYCITPAAGSFDGALFLLGLIKLPMWSVILAWLLSRAKGGLAVALAVHAGAHLDNLQRAQQLDWTLHGVHIALLAVLALYAARSLASARTALPEPITSSA